MTIFLSDLSKSDKMLLRMSSESTSKDLYVMNVLSLIDRAIPYHELKSLTLKPKEIWLRTHYLSYVFRIFYNRGKQDTSTIVPTP